MNVKKLLKKLIMNIVLMNQHRKFQTTYFLDVLLMKIRNMAIQMSSKLTRERREHKAKISNNLTILHDMYADTHWPLFLDMINDLERDLEKIRKYELRGYC